MVILAEEYSGEYVEERKVKPKKPKERKLSLANIVHNIGVRK